MMFPEDVPVSITLKDIAQELNISINAVSRALRNMPDIGPDTTKLVHETAHRMGYRKNLAASYLKTARSMTLGIIVPDVCNPVFSHMYRGVEKICGNMGYTLMLANSGERPDKESAQLDSMIARGIDGVFIVPSIQNSALSKQLETAKIPYVLLQRKPSEHLSHFVQSDDFEGGYLAAKHLYTLGHRSFLLIFPSLLISSAQERYHGFLSYLRENGVSDSAVSVLECDGTRDSGYEAMHTWLAEHATNSRFLSSDVVTEFRGRGDEIHVWPLSFMEFMSVYESSKEDGWAEYLMYTTPIVDTIFVVVEKAKKAKEKFGKENVIDATIGSLYKEDGIILAYDSVYKYFDSIPKEI